MLSESTVASRYICISRMASSCVLVSLLLDMLIMSKHLRSLGALGDNVGLQHRLANAGNWTHLDESIAPSVPAWHMLGCAHQLLAFARQEVVVHCDSVNGLHAGNPCLATPAASEEPWR